MGASAGPCKTTTFWHCLLTFQYLISGRFIFRKIYFGSCDLYLVRAICSCLAIRPINLLSEHTSTTTSEVFDSRNLLTALPALSILSIQIRMSIVKIKKKKSSAPRFEPGSFCLMKLCASI